MTPKKLYLQLKNELQTYLDPFDEDLLSRAYKFAYSAHEGQKRKSGEPYIIHPIGAAIILAKMRVDLPTIVTCLLHDVPEDTAKTIEDIDHEFGEQIASLVGGITKLSAVYYKHNMQDRQIDTLRRMFLVMAKDVRVVLVKLADRLHNMRTLNHVKPEKAKRIAKETMEIFSPLAKLLGVWQIRQEMDDLCFRYVYPTEYKHVESLVEKHRKQSADNLKSVVSESKELLATGFKKVEIEGRWKHLFSIYKKMLQNKNESVSLYDVPVIRITLSSKADCYAAVGRIHEKWKPQPSRFRDYIAVPKPNGYQSLHTTVFGPKGELVEFHIGTKEMDLRAKFGIASEFIFKRSGKPADINTFLEDTPWVKKILKLQTKNNIEFIEDLKLNVLSDRVFVFSPSGDVIDLPEGSSPLDYAYGISTEMGNKYSHATVNKEKKPMSYELKTGDIVEIFVKKSVKPERDWLYFVITDEAKEGIKKVFKKRSKLERQKLGEMIMDNIFLILGKGSFRNLPERSKKQIASEFRCQTAELFLIRVGSGDIPEQKILKTLKKKDKVLFKPHLFSLKRLYSKLFRIKNYQNVRVRLKLQLTDRVGLLSDIFDVLSHHSINITKLTARESKFGRDNAAIDFIHLQVKDLNQLKRAIKSLESIRGVDKVTQKTTAEFFAFYGSIVAAMLTWILHPILVSRYTHDLFDTQADYLQFFWGTSVLILLVILFLRKFSLAHLPKLIARKRFTIFMNFTLLLIVIMIIGESPMFGLTFPLILVAPIVFFVMMGGLLYTK